MKKLICVTLTLLLLAGAFAGCGGAAPVASQPAASSAPAAASSAAASTSQTPAAQNEEVTIKFACWDYELYGYDKDLVEGFMEKNPNVKVEVIDIPNQDYENKINIMMSGGEQLDAMYAKSAALFGTLVGKNQLYDLAPLIERDNIDLLPYGAAVPGYMSQDDQIFGLPYRYDRFLLYYNKDIFDEAGEPYPPDDLTWADYRALAMKLTKGSGQDKIYGAFFSPIWYCFHVPGMQRGEGGIMNMNMESWREGWQAFYDMMYTDGSAQDYASLKSISADQTYFMKGNAAMTIIGSWYMNTINTEVQAGRIEFNWGAQRAPVSEGMKAAGKHGTAASITPIVMSSNTKDVEASWALLKFVASEDAAKILASHLITPGYFSEAVFDTMTQVPGFDMSGKEAMLNSPDAYPNASGVSKYSGALLNMLYEQIELLFTQNQTLDETLAYMESQREEILAE